jgi:hypothetical protein
MTSLSSGTGVELLPNLGSGGSWVSWTTEFIFRTDPTAVTDNRTAIGFGNPSNTGTSDNIWIEMDSAGITCSSGTGTAGNLILVTRASSVDRCTDTGITAANATWYKVKLYSTVMGTVNAQIAVGTGAYGSVVSSSTNVPTNGLTPMMWTASSTAGVTAKANDFDYFDFYGVLTSR